MMRKKVYLFNIEFFRCCLGYFTDQRGIFLKVQIDNNLQSKLVAILFELFI